MSGGIQFRASDAMGRPIPAAELAAEGETARADRIRQLQDRWQPREIPSLNPAEIMAEYLASSPERRMGKLAMRLAENGSLDGLIAAELEPRPGEEPGPMIAAMQQQNAEHYAAAQANTGRMR